MALGRRGGCERTCSRRATALSPRNGGEPVSRFILANEHGLRLQCLTYGATITTLMVPDRDGAPGDIVLGFDTIEA